MRSTAWSRSASSRHWAVVERASFAVNGDWDLDPDWVGRSVAAASAVVGGTAIADSALVATAAGTGAVVVAVWAEAAMAVGAVAVQHRHCALRC